MEDKELAISGAGLQSPSQVDVEYRPPLDIQQVENQMNGVLQLLRTEVWVKEKDKR